MQVNIAGVVVSDLVLSVTVPFLVYWATALFYEALAYVRIPWVEQYRIHPAAAEKQYNLVWCLRCLLCHCGLTTPCCMSSCCGMSLSLDCAYRQRQRHARIIHIGDRSPRVSQSVPVAPSDRLRSTTSLRAARSG